MYVIIIYAINSSDSEKQLNQANFLNDVLYHGTENYGPCKYYPNNCCPFKDARFLQKEFVNDL